MKRFIVFLFALPVLACSCRTDHQARMQDASWASLPRLEGIAKDYAKQHEIAFDFTNARPDLSFDDKDPNIAFVSFYHGRHDTFYQACIDRSEKVLAANLIEPPP